MCENHDAVGDCVASLEPKLIEQPSGTGDESIGHTLNVAAIEGAVAVEVESPGLRGIAGEQGIDKRVGIDGVDDAVFVDVAQQGRVIDAVNVIDGEHRQGARGTVVPLNRDFIGD